MIDCGYGGRNYHIHRELSELRKEHLCREIRVWIAVGLEFSMLEWVHHKPCCNKGFLQVQ